MSCILISVKFFLIINKKRGEKIMIKKTLIMTIQIYIVAIIARFILVWFYKSDNIIFQIVTGILIAYAGFWFCRIILKKNLTEYDLTRQ